MRLPSKRLVTGEPNDVVIYNPQSGKSSITSIDSGPSNVVAGTKLYLAGGAAQNSATAAVNIYDARSHRWTRATLSQARSDISCAVVDDKILFVGGLLNEFASANRPASNVIDIYDISSRKWTTATLPEAYADAAVTVVDDTAIFAGGKTSFGDPERTDAVDMYDGRTGRWSHSILPHTGESVTAVTVGSKAFITLDNFVNVYDGITKTWSSTMLTQPASPQMYSLSLGTKALFIGETNSAIDVYDASTNEWSTSPLTVRSAQQLGVTTLGTTAYVAGGLNENHQNSNVVDLYKDLTPSAAVSGSIVGTAGGDDFITLTNSGDAAQNNTYTIQLYASVDRTLNGAILIGSRKLGGSLRPGKSVTHEVRSRLPKGVALGSYHLLASIRDGLGNVTPVAIEDSTFSAT